MRTFQQSSCVLRTCVLKEPEQTSYEIRIPPEEFVFMKACRMQYGSSIATVVYSSLVNPNWDNVVVVPKKLLSKKLYGWMHYKNRFRDLIEEEKNWIAVLNGDSTRQRTVYLYLNFIKQLQGFSVIRDEASLTFHSTDEKAVAEELFSFLRTNKFDTMVVAGVRQPDIFLKELYKKHWTERYISYIDAVEILDLREFCHRYAYPAVSFQSAYDLQQYDESMNASLHLADLANNCGLARHCLLDFTTQELLTYFQLKGSPSRNQRAVLLKNVFKNSTRWATLQTLGYLVEDKLIAKPHLCDTNESVVISTSSESLVKRYLISFCLSQEVCLWVMNAAGNVAKEYYKGLLHALGDYYELNEYVYSQNETNSFQAIDRLAVFLHIPEEYTLELTEAGDLLSNVSLEAWQIQALKDLLPILKDVKEIYTVLN